MTDCDRFRLEPPRSASERTIDHALELAAANGMHSANILFDPEAAIKLGVAAKPVSALRTRFDASDRGRCL